MEGFTVHYVWMFIVGLVVGGCARLIMPGRSGMGFFMTGLLGIAGSFIGGLIARIFSKPQPGAKFHPAGFFMSVIGALVLLFLWGRLAH
jgi:uncharacterized membrane protein YeaQ/YmgE (transglycosylase-associated protein family)